MKNNLEIHLTVTALHSQLMVEPPEQLCLPTTNRTGRSHSKVQVFGLARLPLDIEILSQLRVSRELKLESD